MVAKSNKTKRSRDTADVPPRKKLCRPMAEGPSFNAEPIMLEVGPEKEKLYFQEDILRKNSPFFENMLSKDWKEATERIIRLPESQPEIVKIYLQWIQSGNFFLIKDEDKITDDKEELRFSQVWDRWHECYVLGDFLQDKDFLDAAIDVLIECAVESGDLPIEHAKTIYDHSSRDCPHRYLAVHLLVHSVTRDSFDLLASLDAPKQFLVDVIHHIAPKLEDGVRRYSIAKLFRPDNLCKYHYHNRLGKPCYKTKF